MQTIGLVMSTLTGTGLLLVGLYQRRKIWVSQDWPQTVGTITKARVEKEESIGEYGNSTSYSPRVEYDYVVNGVRLTGKKIGFGRHAYMRARRAEADLSRYPLNSTVTVFFDPEKPSDAVLVKEAPSSMMLIIGGILILGITVAGLLYSTFAAT